MKSACCLFSIDARQLGFVSFLWALLSCAGVVSASESAAEIPSTLNAVLEHTQPLPRPRGGRLPLFVLPISGCLKGLSDQQAAELLRLLEERGIGYTVDWRPSDFDASLAEGLRIGRLQRQIGQPVSIDATACLMSFCNGSPATLHVDSSGQKFSESSCGAELGCPFALEQRIPAIRKQVQQFVIAYQRASIDIDFIFADWEIDGPIEWNGSWAASQRCVVCREQLPDIDDFYSFQSALRKIRSRLQREAFAEPVSHAFPQALVGNYGVNPHDGHRYWYDYFEETAADSMPFLRDHGARYRPWYPEFPETGYTFAMPVIYTWYRTFEWYDFDSSDYRWFYNMLKEASSAGQQTPAATPLIPFVHWHTTAPPEQPDSAVTAMSGEAYQDLLWHMLLRGHDTFFVWCLPAEISDEIRLVHQVYRESHQYQGFLARGEPLSFVVPSRPGTVVSGLRLGDQALLRRSDYGAASATPAPVSVSPISEPTRLFVVPLTLGNHLVSAQTSAATEGLQHPSEIRTSANSAANSSANSTGDSTAPTDGDGASRPPLLLRRGDERLFPIGFYELPDDEPALQEMIDAGINLIRCNSRSDLDRVHACGGLGWISVAVQQGATAELRRQIEALVDHPALAVWEGPDEIIWNFTAYSGLKKTAGFTRQDWYEQKPRAVEYAKAQAEIILPNMRAGIAMLKELDPLQRPFWMNEAVDSDLRYSRGYVNSVDCLGCDYYPVRGNEPFDLRNISRSVERWKSVGRGKPVWMVLQAFSWHTMMPARGLRYPHFSETRYMAYASIVHGAQAVLYWGSPEIGDPAFRQSLYAMTSELASLQPFLTQPPQSEPRAVVVPDLFEAPGQGVSIDVRRSGEDMLVILVNEDDQRHLGVDVQGLAACDGRALYELYGSDSVRVDHAGFATRLKPLEARLYCTRRNFESPRVTGRNYRSAAPSR